MQQHPEVRHIRVEDGPGLPLGRSFAVKLWPTFVFLRGGKMTKRLVRPAAAQLAEAMKAHHAGDEDKSR